MTQAYIIHERPYNEKKKYIVFFSQEKGVDSISTSSKKSVHYFNQYQTLQSHRKFTLSDPAEYQASLIGKKLYCGLYLNELIYRFCKPLDPHPDLFDQYALSLSLLRQNADTEITLRHFELKLLEACGYGIDIVHIKAPYVAFNKHHGFIGQQQASNHNISLENLTKMVQELQPSQEVKYFFRHILHTLLSSSLQSRLFYEKIT